MLATRTVAVAYSIVLSSIIIVLAGIDTAPCRLLTTGTGVVAYSIVLSSVIIVLASNPDFTALAIPVIIVTDIGVAAILSTQVYLTVACISILVVTRTGHSPADVPVILTVASSEVYASIAILASAVIAGLDSTSCIVSSCSNATVTVHGVTQVTSAVPSACMDVIVPVRSVPMAVVVMVMVVPVWTV